jgi:hypothetical protein
MNMHSSIFLKTLISIFFQGPLWNIGTQEHRNRKSIGISQQNIGMKNIEKFTVLVFGWV